MLRLIGIVISIGLADSANPSTIGPGLYLAGGEHNVRNVLEFTAGVVAVYFVGGAIIALGPGQLLLALVPHPDRESRQILEIVIGAVVLAVGIVLWRRRHRLMNRPQRERPPGRRRNSALLGAGITLVELPTAFPYFAAIAAIVGSGLAAWRQVLLLVLYNLCFVLPLIVIAGMLFFFGEEAQAKLRRARTFLHRHWPIVLAVLAMAAGVIAIVLGATGFIAQTHTSIGRFVRHFRQ